MMFAPDFSGIELKLRRDEDQVRVFDFARRKWVVLTPEEHVRQYLLQYLALAGYPQALIASEKGILVGGRRKRFDVVVYDRGHQPWMLAECKAPDIDISQNTLYQLLQYQQTIQSSYWLLTNGRCMYCADARDPARIEWLGSLPAYNL